VISKQKFTIRAGLVLSCLPKAPCAACSSPQVPKADYSKQSVLPVNRLQGALIYVFLVLCVLLLSTASVNAQELSAADSSNTTKPWPAVSRSLILPGWGQIYQERLWPAAAFYATSATFTYRTLFHYYHYSKTKNRQHWELFKKNLGITLLVYSLNIIDVSYAAYYRHPQKWRGALLSNKPLKSPWGAALRSAILPGWGQYYTASYWKAAGYLLADGYLVYRIRQADLRYRQSKAAADRNERSKFSWYFGLAYLITMADAYSGAYMYQFDEAVKLTLAPEVSFDKAGFAVYVSF